MSFSVTALVWSRSRAKGIAKLVHLALADHARADGRGWASVERLPEKTGLDRRTVQRSLRALEDLGEAVVIAGGGRGRAYTFYLPVVQRAEDAAPETAAERRLSEPETAAQRRPLASAAEQQECTEGTAGMHGKGGAVTPHPVYSRSSGAGPGSGLPTPLPPSPAGKGERRRSSGTNGRATAGTSAPPTDVMPASPDDRAVWGLALERMPSMTPGNRDELERLEPIGRTAEGGLCLLAPPLSHAIRFRGMIAVALKDAGDVAAGLVSIVETPS